MADEVHATLDQMVAPLADLLDRNIFSQSEIHAIVARRRESEYLLRRRAQRKADYLRYIQDELQLEKLRQLRTKKQQSVERERLAKLGRWDEWRHQTRRMKKHIGDVHIIQNIHLLFRRALRKYSKDDVSIYLQYAEACKQLHSYTKLPQVYAEAVQLHPHCSGLWIEAASFEFFHRQSVSAARILLQRALRINKTAKDLWLQSFALEFHYIAKMHGRKILLHLDAVGAEEELKTSSSEPGQTVNVVAKIVYDSAIEAIPDDVPFRLQFLDLCQTFPYTESMEEHIFKTIDRDCRSNPKAWIALAAYQLQQENSDEVVASSPKGFAIARKDGYKGNKNDSDEGGGDTNNHGDSDRSIDSDNQEGRPAKKRRGSEREDTFPANCDPVLAMIRRAIIAVETTDMYLQSISFLWAYRERVKEVREEEQDEKIEAKRHHILRFLHELLNEAATKDLSIYSVSLALEHADFYVRLDQIERGRQVLVDFKDAAVEKEIRLTPVWLKLAELTFHLHSSAGALDVLNEGLKCTCMTHPDYLRVLLQVLDVELTVVSLASGSGVGTCKASKDATETFQKVLWLASSDSLNYGDDDDSKACIQATKETSFGIKTVEKACLQFLMQMIKLFGSIQGTRKTCKMVLHQSNFIVCQSARTTKDIETLVEFFDKCLWSEIDNLKKGSKKLNSQREKDKGYVRQLFEAAICVFRDVPSLAAKYQQERLEASLL